MKAPTLSDVEIGFLNEIRNMEKLDDPTLPSYFDNGRFVAQRLIDDYAEIDWLHSGLTNGEIFTSVGDDGDYTAKFFMTGDGKIKARAMRKCHLANG